MTVGVHEFWTFALCFARITALVGTAPVFGSRAIPHQTKVGLSALLALVLMPIVSSRVGPAPADILSFAAQVGAEVAVGLTLGFLATLVFASVQVAGAFLDMQMGFGIMSVLNPLNDMHSSEVGTFLYQLAITLFLLAGGHLYLVGTLADGYAALPPGSAGFSGDLSGTLLAMAGQMFALAFRIAAPAAAVLLVVDVAFAVVARAVPQVNVLIVGLPVKILVGLMTVALLLPALAAVIGQMTPGIGGAAEAFYRAAR